jgi:hypothetical protein
LRYRFGIYLRVTAGNQHLCPRIQALGSTHQLSGLPIRTIGDGASVDHVTIGFLIELHNGVRLSQAALNYGGVVLIDLATERDNGNLHVIRNELQISYVKFHTFGGRKFEI